MYNLAEELRVALDFLTPEEAGAALRGGAL